MTNAIYHKLLQVSTRTFLSFKSCPGYKPSRCPRHDTILHSPLGWGSRIWWLHPCRGDDIRLVSYTRHSMIWRWGSSPEALGNVEYPFTTINFPIHSNPEEQNLLDYHERVKYCLIIFFTISLCVNKWALVRLKKWYHETIHLRIICINKI